MNWLPCDVEIICEKVSIFHKILILKFTMLYFNLLHKKSFKK